MPRPHMGGPCVAALTSCDDRNRCHRALLARGISEKRFVGWQSSRRVLAICWHRPPTGERLQGRIGRTRQPARRGLGGRDAQRPTRRICRISVRVRRLRIPLSFPGRTRNTSHARRQLEVAFTDCWRIRPLWCGGNRFVMDWVQSGFRNRGLPETGDERSRGMAHRPRSVCLPLSRACIPLPAPTEHRLDWFRSPGRLRGSGWREGRLRQDELRHKHWYIRPHIWANGAPRSCPWFLAGRNPPTRASRPARIDRLRNQMSQAANLLSLDQSTPMAYHDLHEVRRNDGLHTSQVIGLLADDEYRALQASLILRPEQGAVIRGSGGLRKVRWGARGAGKRGGIRVIYYWFLPGETFLMLFAYPKNVQDDLTPEQLKVLRQFVEKEFP